MSAELVLLVKVLIEHQRIPLFDGSDGQRCVGCDNLRGEPDGPNSPRHAEHLARAVLASDWLAERERATAEKAWDAAIQAVAWCLDNGEPSAAAALAYVAKNNAYRKTPEGDAR